MRSTQLAYYKAPGYVAFVDALPLTPSQKIQRGQLRELAHALPGQAALHRHAAHEEEAGHEPARMSYEGVAVAVPVTVPYVRYSTARRALVHRPGAAMRWSKSRRLAKEQIDGLCVSSFSLVPDTAVGVTQHLGLSPRWLDHMPDRRRLRRDVRCAAPRVRCRPATPTSSPASRADTNHVDSFRQTLGSFSNFARDASYPYGSGGPNSIFAFITANYMRTYGAQREDFGRIAVDQRANALRNPNALFKKPLTLDEYMAARADLRPDPPVRLRDALRRRRGLPGDERGAGARPRPAACRDPRRHRAPQRLRRRPGDDARRLARRSRRPLRAGRRAARADSISCRPTTTTR